MAGLCYVTPVTGHKAYTGKEEEEDNCSKKLPLSETLFNIHLSPQMLGTVFIFSAS
jgi:hypothetical protein